MLLLTLLMSSVVIPSLADAQKLFVSAPVPAKISTFGIVEFEISTGRAIANPFDPEQAQVDGTFSLAGRSIVLPAFWDGRSFRLRFCPPKPGLWKLAVTIKTPGGVLQESDRSFHVAGSSKQGFVRIAKSNPRYFSLDSGATFVPIGLNLCWPDKTGLASYDHRFAKLKSVGGNFARIWTTQDKRLETEKVGLGRYDMDAAAYYDGIFALAEKHGIRTMLTFDDYRVLAKTDYFNAHWDQSPYNAANGGPLKEPTDFFANPACRKFYKQRLRYLVARYSAFPSLAIWELYNEQDNIPKPGVPIEWFREMTEYLASIDPYRHPITTSYSWDDKPEVWLTPAVGLTQRHMYGQGDTVDFVSMIVESSHKLGRYEKPRLIGEFGITWKEPDIALDKAKLGTPLHDALWASIMTGDAGGALTWWWDNYLEPLDLWHVYVGISRFVSAIDFANRDFLPIRPKVKGMTALGLQDSASGEAILWLHDPHSTWKADASGIIPRQWTDVHASVPAIDAMTVEVWNTRTGEIIARNRQAPEGGFVDVKLPPFERDIAIHLQKVTKG